MSHVEKQNNTVALYPGLYSGIPARLLPKALKEKSRLQSNRTKDEGTQRKRDVAIPAGISKHTFLQALEELSEKLGRENVELNDKPLKDGW